jgi:ribonucleoside-triphosphate reductase
MEQLSESLPVDTGEESVLPSNQLDAISEYTFVTKYARYDAKKKRRETWDEAVDRVRDMHLQRYGNKGIEEDITWAFECVRRKEVLPSMRSMQFGGDAIIANDARMYNCAYTHADRHRFFSEAFWMLLSGVGVGFSVQKHHVAKLPKLIEYRSPNEKEIFTYVVGDTIEGWADALDVLMSTYFQGTPNSGREVFFDFSRIRRKGTWLKTSGGRAPGADPLRIALKRIKQVLRDAVEARQEQLRPIQVYDIGMMAADAVISGGIRRSATIAIFSHDDQEMMTAKSFFDAKGKVLSNKRKDGSWLTEYGVAWNLKDDKDAEPKMGEQCPIGWSNIMPWRARSNNSVGLLRKECTKEQFDKIIENAKLFGEPGFVFLDNLEYGYNPCVEIGLNPVDISTGEVGWQVCNLTEINGGKIKTKEDFKRAVRAATIIGTLQAGYTYFHYLTDVSRRIIRRERLLGVSVTGWMENPELTLQPELQREMAQYAVEVNREFATRIDIEPAARVTCTKPSGNSSLILGTSSGIHPHHYYEYFRRVQGSSTEQPLQFFKLFNPQAVEASVWGQQGEVKSEVITFCVQVPKTAKVKDDLTAIEFLKIVKSTYENWVLPGTAIPESSPGLTHNVSNTVKVAVDEWDSVRDFIYENRDCFSGISLIPASGDKIYRQAPLEKIESPEDVKKWNELVKTYHSIDWSQFSEGEDYTQLLGEVACAGGACSV